MTPAGRSTARPCLLALLVPLITAVPVAAQDHGAHHHPASAPAPAAPAIPAPERIGGLKIPDVPLLDQEGRPVHFYSDLVRGRVVVVNFVFTSCTAICPPMGAVFGELRKQLGARAGRDVHLISVSVDPANDTPARMKEWSARFGAGPGWTLVTGPRAEVTKLLKAFGVFAANINDHSPLVLLGNDARGEWTRAYGISPPATLAKLIDQVAAPAARTGGKR
jgi:cytochrome oxidase Cu insertion factor (SCO1/SenC/PrrC family)